MKKLSVFLALALFFLTSCGSVPRERGTAEAALRDILARFGMEDGVIYGDGEGEEPLSDGMLASLLCEGGASSYLRYVESRAVYFSRRFSPHEILVLRLSDKSHRQEAVTLLRRRAEKKKNAVVYADGVYVFLLCTDKNAEILSYIK